MADKELRIKLTIDDADSRRAAVESARDAKKIDAAVKELGRTQDATHAKNAKGFEAAGVAGGQFGDVLRGVAGQFTLLNATQAGFAVITGMWDQWKKDSLESAKNIANVREQLLELAALKGRLGDTTTENMAQLNFRSKTLQTAEAARAFQGEYLNVGAPNIGKRINAEQSRILMEKAGLFQAAEGGDAMTHARLAGIMPALMGKDNLSADEAFAAEMKTYNQMQKGGFTFSSGAKQLVDKQSLVTSGVFKDPARMIGMLTAVSNVVSPEQAGTTLEQIVDATTGSLRRRREGKIEGDTMAASDYYKSIGATDQMDPAAISEKVFKDFDRQKAEETKNGRQFNAWTYLQGRGFMNREAITGLMSMYGSYENGQWQGHMDRAASPTGLDAADVNDPNYLPPEERMRRFVAGPTGDKRRVDAMKGMAGTAAGLPTESYRNLQAAAFYNLRARGEATGDDPDAYINDYTFNGARRLDLEIKRVTEETARRKGVAFDRMDLAEETGDYAPWADGSGRARRYQAAAAAVDGTNPQGGSIMQTFSDEIKKNTEAVTQNTQRMEQQRAGVAPPALPAAPAPAMKRP